MKISFEVDDITLFMKALNNAYIAYNEIIFATIFRCEVPKKLEKLKELPDEELQARLKCLYDVYKQLEKYERED